MDTSNPDYYKNRSIECIEFTRHLNFTLGSAFKYLWRLGGKDSETQEWGKIRWYLNDANVLRPTFMSAAETVHLIEDLFSIKHEFESDIFDLLIAILTAASGHYMLLDRDLAHGGLVDSRLNP